MHRVKKVAGGKIFSQILRIGSAVGILAFCWWTWGLVARYDWGTPEVKVPLVVLFSFVACGIGARDALKAGTGLVTMGVAGVSVIGILAGFQLHGLQALGELRHAPRNDIGETTMSCAAMFWRGGTNPYTDDSVNPRPELPRGFRGFHYGPGMLLCYAGSAFGENGYRVCQSIWVALMLAAGCLLVAAGERGTAGKVTACLFFLAILSSSHRWWDEYFRVGVNDPAALALLGLSLYFIRTKKWGVAGFLAGFSFAAKFSPALFLMGAVLRRGTPSKFWLGVAAGCFPLIGAIPMAPVESFRNIFLSRFYVRTSPTGLFYLLPEGVHTELSLILLAFMVVVVVRGWRGGHGFLSILVSFVALTTLGMLGHREFHANHLTWLLYFGAILLAAGRENLWNWLGGGGLDGEDRGAVPCRSTGGSERKQDGAV